MVHLRPTSAASTQAYASRPRPRRRPELINLAGPLYGELPGYVWDERLRGGRYREVLPDGKLGKFVSSEAIARDLATLHDAFADHLGGLAADMVDGKITPAVFQLTVQQQIKNAAVANTALANGGWTRVSQAGWGRAGAMLVNEYFYLRRFVAAYNNGELSREATIDRARLYAGNAYGRYYDERDYYMLNDGATLARLVVNPDERLCKICKGIADEGWKPIRSIIIPVHGRCRCAKEYQ